MTEKIVILTEAQAELSIDVTTLYTEIAKKAGESEVIDILVLKALQEVKDVLALIPEVSDAQCKEISVEVRGQIDALAGKTIAGLFNKIK